MHCQNKHEHSFAIALVYVHVFLVVFVLGDEWLSCEVILWSGEKTIRSTLFQKKILYSNNVVSNDFGDSDAEANDEDLGELE